MEKIAERILEVLLRIEQRIINNNGSENSQPVSLENIIKDAVSLHVDENGKYDGVLVKTLDKEFIVALENYTPQPMNASILNEVEKDKEWRLMKPVEGLLILIYREEINSLLKRFGTVIDSSEGLGYWIAPKNDKRRYMRLAYLDEVYQTTSTENRYYVRCVKDVKISESKKEENSGTYC